MAGISDFERVAFWNVALIDQFTQIHVLANLTTVKDDITTVTKYMDECKNLEIPVLSPDVNESELNFTVNKDLPAAYKRKLECRPLRQPAVNEA